MPLRELLSSDSVDKVEIAEIEGKTINVDGTNVTVFIDKDLVTTVGRVTLEEGKVKSITVDRVRQILVSQGLIPNDDKITVM